jgi:hypothetical protein
MQNVTKLKPAQLKAMKDWEDRVERSVDKTHKARIRQATKKGATATELERLEAKFQADRPSLIQTEKKARMDAYPQTAEGIEMARLSGEADLAYRQQLAREQEAQQQQ